MTTPVLKRKRGAQPGNTNALKHGFYTRQPHTPGYQPSAIPASLYDEAARLRHQIASFSSRLGEDLDPTRASALLRVLNSSFSGLTRLLHARQVRKRYAACPPLQGTDK